MRQHPRRTLDDLIGEKPGFARIKAAHLHLAANVAEDLFKRVAARIHRTKGAEPFLHECVQKVDMDRFFALVIIDEVGFVHPAGVGDLIECRAAKPMCREKA